MAGTSPAMTIKPSLPPHFLRDFHDLRELGPLLLFGKDIALLGGGEAALRRQRELPQWREFRRLLDAALDVILVLQRAALGRDQPQHHDLLAFGQKPQRLETAG